MGAVDLALPVLTPNVFIPGVPGRTRPAVHELTVHIGRSTGSTARHRTELVATPCGPQGRPGSVAHDNTRRPATADPKLGR